MTLHLHLLLCIEGAPTLQQLQDKLKAGDKEFERAITSYLESCRVGEFQMGTMDKVKSRVPDRDSKD
jgi:hypothetical protein